MKPGVWLFLAGITAGIALLFVTGMEHTETTVSEKEVKQPTAATPARELRALDDEPSPPPAPLQIWSIVDPASFDSSDLPSRLRGDVPAVLVALERSRLLAATAGDELLMPTMSGSPQAMIIDEIVHRPGLGVSTFRGHVPHGGQRLPATITLGGSSTFATLSLAEGPFELRGSGELAWMYSEADLQSDATNGVDYVVQPEREHKR